MAAATEAGANEGEAYEQALAERGYVLEDDTEYEPEWQQPEEYEEEDDSEGWTADETEWEQPAEPVQVDYDSAIGMFDQHLSQLESDFGVPLTTNDRRQIYADSLEHGGLNNATTERLFRRSIAQKLTAEETARQERRTSKDPNVRRAARREAIVNAMERGQS